MREDQFLKLQSMSEKLADVMLVELDPDTWPAADVLPKDLTQQDRGNRYWSKKNAAATLTLVMRINTLVTQTQTLGGTQPTGNESSEEEFDIDKDIAKLEREAAKRVDEVAKQRDKREFDKRTLGKHVAQ